MRTLLFVISATLFAETLMYAAISPLLPILTRSYMLSKRQAGLLVAAYALGQVAAALPLVYLVSKAGVKVSALSGLIMLSATSVAFGLATGYGQLLSARLLQGVAGALCWSGGLAWLTDALPRERRGEMIGIAMGVSATGLVVGPVLGGGAALIGRNVAFTGLAVAAVLLAAYVARLRSPLRHTNEFSLPTIASAHKTSPVIVGQMMLLLPGLFLGTLGLLAPLRLYRLGFTSTEIAATFLLAAATGILLRPLVGRWSDRHGRLAPIRLCLAASVPISLMMPQVANSWLFAALVISAFTIYEILWGPVIALLSDAYEAAGIAQGSAFALMNISSGSGIVVGSAAGGLLSQFFGDAVVYIAIACVCLATFAKLRTQATAEKDSHRFL